MIKNKTFLIIIIAGFAMLLFGLWRGEFGEILHIGISLCLDCMGLGNP